jgi:hypothetical protein
MAENNNKLKKFLRFFLTRLPFVLILAAVLLGGSLKLVERYPVPLKEGFENFLSEKTNSNTTIGTLDEIKFIPAFTVSMNNLTMHNRDNAAIIDLSVKSVNFKAPFWTVFLNGKTINELRITDVQAAENILSPLPMTVEKITIEEKNGPQQYGAFLVANGTYGGKKLFFEAALEKRGEAYKIPKEIPFVVEIGNYALNANYKSRFSGALLEQAVFSRQDQVTPARNYVLTEDGEFVKTNPLICMLHSEDLSDCDNYLTEEE